MPSAFTVQNDVDAVRRQLKKDMLNLAASLQRAAKRLDDPSAPHPVNASGEVQGQGLEIDRACALYPRLLAERTRLEMLRTASKVDIVAKLEAAGWKREL